MSSSATPLMRQYASIKQHYPDALLFFQVGDFYELFFEDAQKAAGFLGITLTQRGTYNNQPIPLCGVPVHTVDHYIARLVKGGFRVVLCDQLVPPQPGKVVERGVTQVLTPGTLTDSRLLNDKTASYVVAIVNYEDKIGFLAAELLTGMVVLTECPHDMRALEVEIARYLPDEILLLDSAWSRKQTITLKAQGYVTTLVQAYDLGRCQEWVAEKGFFCVQQSQASFHALALLIAFLDKNQPAALPAINAVHCYAAEDFLIIDQATQRNLEIVRNTYDGTERHSLFSVLDRAQTGMGSRLIKKWLLRPLVERASIEARLDAVGCFVAQRGLVHEVKDILTHTGDLERIAGRIALKRAQLQDLFVLKRALELFPAFSAVVARLSGVALFHNAVKMVGAFDSLLDLLQSALPDDATASGLIKQGFNPELDLLRALVNNGTCAIAELEKKEQEATGISSLKIRYAGPHGYAFEVTKTHRDALPSTYIRTQTLVNKERFTTPALKQLEYDVQRAEADSQVLEKNLFAQLKETVEHNVRDIKRYAFFLANLDALQALGQVAYDNNYTRPTFHGGRDIQIVEGKHPVVFAALGHSFIPNDTLLTADQRLWIITGPNMGGKSTFLRQTALICLMAQAGSWVPARSAVLPLIDRIFTRIGANDNVAAGKSTFLVEMEETATICTQATKKSLVILDEVGRGTSTYDGLALAQAIVEYLYATVEASCLFATHYHELTELAQMHTAIACYHAASTQSNQGIILLHKIMQGTADGSFGIEVALQAGMPTYVIQRARELLHSFEGMPVTQSAPYTVSQKPQDYDLLCKKNNMLTAIDLDEITPRQAFMLLGELKKMG